MNTIPSSSTNPGSRPLRWGTIRKIRGVISRAAGLFGKEVTNLVAFNSQAFFNAEAEYQRLKNILVRRRKGEKGLGGEFVSMATKFGVILSDSVAESVADLDVTAVGSTTLDPTWTPLTKEVPVFYEWYVALAASPGVAIDSGEVEDAGTVAVTGLTAETEYIFKVRARWSYGALTYRTGYSSAPFTTTV